MKILQNYQTASFLFVFLGGSLGGRKKKKKAKSQKSLIDMEEVTESAGKGKKMNLFPNYFLPNLPLGAVEKEHHFKSLFLLLAEICVTEIRPCVFF